MENPNDVFTENTPHFFLVIAIALVLFSIISLCIALFPQGRDKGIRLIVSLLFSAFGFAFMFIPAIMSGYKTLGKMLVAYLPFTIFSGVFILIGLIAIIGPMFSKRKTLD